MSESNFREIQLNTKQVVFLFMAVVVAAVGVFLLGVQVGHGVRNDAAAASASAADPASDAPVPTVLPPPTTPKPGDLDYHGVLQGKGDAKGLPATPPNPSADVPPDPAPAVTPVATPSAKATPEPVARKAAAGDPVLPPSAVWFVQVDSFSSKANAQKQISQLQGKGYHAIVFPGPGGGAPFKTRIGPMERNAADALKNRLTREGFKPTVTR